VTLLLSALGVLVLLAAALEVSLWVVLRRALRSPDAELRDRAARALGYTWAGRAILWFRRALGR